MELLKVAATFGYNGKLSTSFSLPGRTEDDHIIVVTHITAYVFILSFFKQNEYLRILAQNKASYEFQKTE